MKWLVTVTVAYVGLQTGTFYQDTFTRIVNHPDEFATAISELVGSAQCDDYTITGVTITPTTQKD